MAQVLKLRIILDTAEDVFRDVEIETDAPLMHLHMATLDAFEWHDSDEMASFYRSNEAWDRGDEIPLMSMAPELPSMESCTVAELLPTLSERAVYVYDYLRMWCFYLEPISLDEAGPDVAYPRLTLEFGKAPHPHSRIPEGLDDLELLAQEVEADQKEDEPYSTGDPELDAYLSDDEEETNDKASRDPEDYSDLY